MSDDESQSQRKFDPPAVTGTGLTGPVEPAAAAQENALPEALDSDERPAQVKVVAPFVAGPAEVAAEEPAAVPAEVSIDRAAQVKAVAPFVATPNRPPAPSAAGRSAPAAAPLAPAPPAASPAVPPPAHTPTEAALGDDIDDDSDYDNDAEDSADDEPDVPLTFADRLRRLSPALVILSILSIGSLVFLAFAMTSHTTPVPVLLSSAVVTGLAFAVDAVVASFMTWHAGQNGEGGKALVLALIGGTSAVIAAGAFAGTLVLALLLSS
ncbi:MAG TPA: hypothetical protein VF344_00555 [Candidatus Limnocylindrales bacterium]